MNRLNLVFLFIILPISLSAQELFGEEQILNIELSGEVKELLRDRGEETHYHSLIVTYKDDNGKQVEVQLKGKTRGHFRKMKSNCKYPPILLNFSHNESANTLFTKQDKLKLVTPCKDDEFVVREYLVYKLYNLITPKSFRARLVKVLFNVENNDKPIKSVYGILLEEEWQMAEHNNSIIVQGKKLRPEQLIVSDFLNLAVFEYMIGNTDWSIQYLQNVKLIAKDSTSLSSPVPYDFDHAGIVGASYAKPTEELLLSSTRERRFRGYCITDMKKYDEVISHFNQLKEEIYAVYETNTIIDDAYKKSTIRYLDEFYKTINDPELAKKEFQYPCDKEGTGNVVIKGLKKN